MKYLILCTIFLYVWNFIGSSSDKCIANAKDLRQYERQVQESPGTSPTETTTLTPDDLLMRLKIYQYAEKLKIKESKKKAKADKKKAKDAAFRAYLTSALAANTAAAAPGPAVGPAMAVPPMPMLPAMGLWKKSFLMAAAAAAMATTTTTTPTPPQPLELTTDSSVLDEDENADSAEEEVIKQMVRRYAPAIREKFYGKNRKYYGHQKPEENSSEDPDEDTEDSGAGNPSYKSGSFNKFGTGPAGSPNGVGYEKAKVNQAGCSGSHIHICSGTTVYLTNPEESEASDDLNIPAGVEEIMSRVQETQEEQDQSEDDQGQESPEDQYVPQPQPNKSHHSKSNKKHGHKNKH